MYEYREVLGEGFIMLCFPVLTVEVSVHTGCIMFRLCIFLNYWSMCTCSSQIYIYQCVMSLFFFFQCQHFQHNLKTVRQVTAEVLKSLNSVSFWCVPPSCFWTCPVRTAYKNYTVSITLNPLWETKLFCNICHVQQNLLVNKQHDNV